MVSKGLGTSFLWEACNIEATTRGLCRDPKILSLATVRRRKEPWEAMAFQRLRGHSVHRGSSRGQVITGQLVGATSARDLGVCRWISPDPLALRSFSASTTPLGHPSRGARITLYSRLSTLRQETGRAGSSQTPGNDLTITTKPTLNGRWIFSFPEEAGTQTDMWACVSEMHMKICTSGAAQALCILPAGWWQGIFVNDALSLDKCPGDSVVT